MKPKVGWIAIPQSSFVSSEFHSPEWVWLTADQLDRFEKRAGMPEATDCTQWCLFEATAYVVEDDL